jgi:hypothetical protein
MDPREARGRFAAARVPRGAAPGVMIAVDVARWSGWAAAAG